MQLIPGSPAATTDVVRLTRRSFNAGSLAAAGGMAVPTLGLATTGLAATSLPSDRHFTVFRDGDAIGRHDVRFAKTGDGITVSTEIDLKVKVAFITAFYFRQSGRERWVAGRLVESRVETDDNGKASNTLIEAKGNELVIQGGLENRVTTVPLGMMTDTAFWNVDIVHQQALIDTQKVVLTDVDAERKGRERIEIGGGAVDAERYLVVADSGRRGEIWFDAAGNWVKGVITTRGETLDYHLAG